jgi:hypothetical protein
MASLLEFRPGWEGTHEAANNLRSHLAKRLFAAHLQGKIGTHRLNSPISRAFTLSTKRKPNELLDTYLALSNEDKTRFCQLLGEASPAEAAINFFGWLEPIERERFTDWITEQFDDLVLPVLARIAREIAQETSHISDDEFERAIAKEFNRVTNEFTNSIQEKEVAKLKAARDRKPDPKTIIRNVEICDLRTKDKKTWTQGRLAKKYGITARAIRKILEEERNWRTLANKLRTN